MTKVVLQRMENNHIRVNKCPTRIFHGTHPIWYATVSGFSD